MMGLLAKLFGRLKKTPIEQVAALVEQAIDTADSLDKFRELLAQKAKAGDFDFAYNEYVRANRRADDYIRNG